METEEVMVQGNPPWKGRVLALRRHMEKGTFIYTIKDSADEGRVEAMEEDQLEAIL